MIRNLLITTTLAAALGSASLVAQAATAPSPDEHLASNIIGKNVYNGTDDNAAKVGSIDDILLNKSGSVESVIVDVSGFLGLGAKDVAMPYNSLSWAEKNGERWLIIKATADQLKAQPAFDRKAYDAAVANKTDASTTNTNGTTVAPSANTSTAAASDKASMSPVDPGKIRSQDLVGTTVYGANDASVGEVGDIVLTKDGKIDAIIIDVGGFLGVGKKEVAVGMEKLQFVEDKNGKRYLYTNFTKDQLKAQPAYDKATWADKRDSQRLVTP